MNVSLLNGKWLGCEGSRVRNRDKTSWLLFLLSSFIHPSLPSHIRTLSALGLINLFSSGLWILNRAYYLKNTTPIIAYTMGHEAKLAVTSHYLITLIPTESLRFRRLSSVTSSTEHVVGDLGCEGSRVRNRYKT